MPGYSQDILTRIINVQWGGAAAFLYSGADGMWSSADGEQWTEAETSVPASSLAWVDGVWIGCNGDSAWRSEDGGASWQDIGFDFKQVAACKPEDSHGDPLPGIFAGYKQDEDGNNELIFVSRDLGKTWLQALSIPTSIPFGDDEDGYEFMQALSGCGNCIFATTIKGDSRYANGDGVVYTSESGGSFSRQQIWTGTNDVPSGPDWVPATHTLGWSPGGIGFDEKTGTYSLTALKQERIVLGTVHFSIIYATRSTDGAFAGEAAIAEAETVVVSGVFTGDAVAGGLSTAGGDGKFVTTVRHDTKGAGSPAPVPANLDVHQFNGGSGSQTLLAIENIFDGQQIGPVVWNKDAAVAKPDGTTQGTFACLAFGAGANGVYIAAGGKPFGKTHSGAGFSDPNRPRGTVAVGRI